MSALIAQAKMLSTFGHHLRQQARHIHTGEARTAIETMAAAANVAADDLREQAKQEVVGP